MLASPLHGRRSYQVGIYNKEVRASVKDNESHNHYNELWATTRYQEIFADSEAEARSIARKKFPPEKGFVIDIVVLAND
jgi:hypothetical protein